MNMINYMNVLCFISSFSIEIQQLLNIESLISQNFDLSLYKTTFYYIILLACNTGELAKFERMRTRHVFEQQ